jgi:hypothetical protein
VVIPGVKEIEVGDKVRVVMPSGHFDVAEPVSGDWIVGEVIHMWSSVGRNYLKKLLLVSDALKVEKLDA